MAKQEVVKEASQQLALRDDATVNAMRDAYAAAGIPMPTELDSPEPEVQEAIDAKSLASARPTSFPGADTESGLLILMTEPKVYDSKLDGAKSFLTATVFDASRKKSFILTHSYEREDGTFTPLGLHLQKLTPGKSVFKIAAFKTSQGFTVVRPIPIGTAV